MRRALPDMHAGDSGSDRHRVRPARDPDRGRSGSNVDFGFSARPVIRRPAGPGPRAPGRSGPLGPGGSSRRGRAGVRLTPSNSDSEQPAVVTPRRCKTSGTIAVSGCGPVRRPLEISGCTARRGGAAAERTGATRNYGATPLARPLPPLRRAARRSCKARSVTPSRRAARCKLPPSDPTARRTAASSAARPISFSGTLRARARPMAWSNDSSHHSTGPESAEGRSLLGDVAHGDGARAHVPRHQPRDGVPEVAHVPRIVPPEQVLAHRVVELRGLAVGPELPHEVLGQREDVLGAFAQGGAAGRSSRRSDSTGRGGTGPSPPRAPAPGSWRRPAGSPSAARCCSPLACRSALHDPQQLGLEGQGQFPHLVDEQRAAVG